MNDKVNSDIKTISLDHPVIPFTPDDTIHQVLTAFIDLVDTTTANLDNSDELGISCIQRFSYQGKHFLLQCAKNSKDLLPSP